MRRLTIGLVGGALAITACGGGSDSAESDPVPPAVTDAPAAEEEPALTPSEDAPATTTAAAAPGQAPADADTADTSTDTDTSTAEATPAAEPEAAPDPEPTTTLAPEPAAAPLGGRALGQALRPESATGSNPLPDLLVDDIRGGTQVNVANILPSALPVLIWAWAPH